MHTLIFTHDHTTTPHNSIHTLLETNIHSEKKRSNRSQPFNVYLTHLLMVLQNYSQACTISLSMHIICIFCLLLLCFFPHIMQKNVPLDTHFHDDITVIMATSYGTLLFYILYIIYSYISSYIMLPLITLIVFCYGIFYLKKSTKISLKYLHALCHFCGVICIIATVPLLFKTLQLIMYN